MKRANTMSTITVELTIKVKTKFTSSNAEKTNEKTNGFISRMSEIFTFSVVLFFNDLPRTIWHGNPVFFLWSAPVAGSHLRLPSGPAGIRTATGSLSALARPTPYQLSHRIAYLARKPRVPPFDDVT